MTTLNNYSTWKSDAIAYWDDQIDTTLDAVAEEDWTPEYDPSSDKAALKAQLRTFMDAFDTAVNAYSADNTRRGPFIDILLALSNYIANKFIAPSPLTPVPNLSAMPNNTTKDLFAWWNQTLPDFETFFQILYDGSPIMPEPDPGADPPIVSVDGEFTLAALQPYTDALAAFGNYVADDLARFSSVVQQVPAAIRERVSYGFFAGADAVLDPQPATIKDYLLNEFAVQEVLDQFNWEILGLNAP
jgi:hypothetical protein